MKPFATFKKMTLFGVVAALAGLAGLVGANLASHAAGDKPAGRDGLLHLAQAAQPDAQDGRTATFSPAQKTEIGKIIKAYLLANPEIMLEVQTALDAKMEQLQAEKLGVALRAHATEIFRRKDDPVAGNTQGDIPVVEFFDYNCGYCKRAFHDVAKLVDQDKHVKLILKELPILSKGSEEATRVALAARKQGKYWEVHRGIISLRAPANERSALKVAAGVPGINMDKLKADMKSPDITAEIDSVRKLAQTMGIQGTPHFLVGDQAIAGAPTDLFQQMENHVKELRKKGGCKIC
ncbi:MAG: DsbA family protein [Hyphomicrobiaceae bacterium]